jgi:vacuolar-type H+-ATPase subunit E/Vma4
MPLEDILKRIEENAASRKTLILENARREASLRKEKAREAIEREVEAFVEKKKREAELKVQRMLAEARLWGRNELSRVKREALRTLRRELENLLLQAIEKQYVLWWKGVLLKAVESGDEEVWMFPQEAGRLGPRFLEDINTSLGYRLSFGGVLEDSSERGFLIKKGGMTVDVSLRAILDEFFRRNEREILEVLFRGVEV